jgi:hypothetical protein
MTDLLKPGDGLVFMKVGTHAQESLPEIVDRKRREIEEAGYALWGYGGNTCHPLHRVQPFAEEFVRRNGKIYLVMQPMISKHWAVPERAKQFTKDGTTWEDIPAAIRVLGSRFALAIRSLEERQFELSLDHTRVVGGAQEGKRGDLYVSGRVDKACLELTEHESPEPPARPPVEIGLVAEIVEPYAVIVQ